MFDCLFQQSYACGQRFRPLPIASITKLLTAMVVVDEMDLDRVVEVPEDISEVEPHKIGIRPGDRFTIRDLLHGMLIASGNDCAEVSGQVLSKRRSTRFHRSDESSRAELGANRTMIYTPSGLDAKLPLGRKEGRTLEAKKWNVATAANVATIARKAFDYPLIRNIAG